MGRIRFAFVGWAATVMAVAVVTGAMPAGQRATGPAPKAPSALTVVSATRSAVSLSWTGGDAAPAKFIVERKPLGAAWPAPVPPPVPPAPPRDPNAPPTPATVATVDTPAAVDGKIDAFATYIYRVRAIASPDALSAPSNEVTVGPPPVGMTPVVAAPKASNEHDPSHFANQVQMGFDANGDPAIAYSHVDPNNDDVPSDNELLFISWNRAKYKWNAPVHVDTVGDIVRTGSRQPFSIARDDSTGRFGLAYMVADHEVRWAWSDDVGATWKTATVQRTPLDEGGMSTPTLAMAGGQVHLAYFLGGAGVRYRTGLASDPPDKWSASVAPSLPDTSEPKQECVKLALDSAGKPVVAYCLNPASGYNLVVALWRPSSDKAVKVADTTDHQTDGPALDMAIVGSQIAIGWYANRDDKFFDNHHVWFVRSADNGATWSAPVVVADDGGHSMGPPVTIAVDRAGHPAMVAERSGGNSDGVKCGMPKLMRSTDGVKWTTCAPDTKGGPAESDVTYPVIGFAGNDKLYVAFTTRHSVPGLAAGLVLWRER